MLHPVRSRKRDDGQAAVEFAIGFPIVVIVVLAIAQIAVVIRDQLAVELAARDAARAASVTSVAGRAATAGLAATGVEGIDISIIDNGDMVTATASRHIEAMPIVGLVVAGRRVTASVSMLVEPP